MHMRNLQIYAWSVISILFLLTSSSAIAAPMIYSFDSGTVSLRVTRVDTGVSVIAPGDPDPFMIILDGSSVTFDPTTGTNGTILSLNLTATGPNDINLDAAQAGVTTEMVSILNAALTNTATGDRDGGNAFFIPTLMSADISGTLADGFSTGFGPIPVASNTSLRGQPRNLQPVRSEWGNATGPPRQGGLPVHRHPGTRARRRPASGSRAGRPWLHETARMIPISPRHAASRPRELRSVAECPISPLAGSSKISGQGPPPPLRDDSDRKFRLAKGE